MSNGAYGMIADHSTITGIKQGLRGKIEGGWCCGESAGISYGYPVFTNRGESVLCYKYHKDTAKLVFAGDLITDNSTVATVNGVSTAAVVFATDHATTIELLRVAIAGLSTVDGCVLDTTDTDSRTLLIQVKGAEAVAAATVTLGNTQTTASATYGSSQIFIGVAMRVEKAPANDTGTNEGYEYQDSVAVIAAECEVYVKPNATVKAQDACYVYTTAGVDFGRFSSSGTSLNAIYREDGADDVNTRIEVKGHTSMTYVSIF